MRRALRRKPAWSSTMRTVAATWAIVGHLGGRAYTGIRTFGARPGGAHRLVRALLVGVGLSSTCTPANGQGRAFSASRVRSGGLWATKTDTNRRIRRSAPRPRPRTLLHPGEQRQEHF